MFWVVNAEYIEEYKINVVFNDGLESILDMEETVMCDNREIARQLKDIKIFKDFKVDMDTIVWNNGFDLAPEFIRENVLITVNS